jgi:hypothetical protein
MFQDITPKYIFFAERRAHAPLGAGSRVTHGVVVVITGKHLNETAPSGCVSRLVRANYPLRNRAVAIPGAQI